MANPKNTFVSMTLGGKEYKMGFDFNALAELEEKLGRSMLEPGAMNFQSVKEIRYFVWASLLKDSPGITVEEAGALITPSNMADVMAKLNEAQGISLPDAEEVKEGSADPTPPPQ